ncbi:MAG: TM2 domain-containing protein [Acidobacteria bacterium]|jgi:TM2 domain-containing membrane protein YozV|nr:TM2 domain-containing protein [Acidobacteriota bacterium]MCU0253230.1 TM2 domain-containing protein [Acidobacteriota bacterium]
MFCSYCGKELPPYAVVCIGCGGAAPRPPGARSAAPEIGPQTKSRLGAGLLGIFLGALGVHRFYLGFTGIGLAQLLLTVLSPLSCGVSWLIAAAWGFIEGILILVGAIDRDAAGELLRD